MSKYRTAKGCSDKVFVHILVHSRSEASVTPLEAGTWDEAYAEVDRRNLSHKGEVEGFDKEGLLQLIGEGESWPLGLGFVEEIKEVRTSE